MAINIDYIVHIACLIKDPVHTLREQCMLIVCFLLGDSPASEIYMPTFRNTLSHLHRQVGACRMNSAEGNVGVLYGKRFGLEMV